MKPFLTILVLAMLAAPANATPDANGNCTDPCLNNYINIRNGELILSDQHLSGFRPYTWISKEAYLAEVKRICSKRGNRCERKGFGQ